MFKLTWQKNLLQTRFLQQDGLLMLTEAIGLNRILEMPKGTSSWVQQTFTEALRLTATMPATCLMHQKQRLAPDIMELVDNLSQCLMGWLLT